MKAVQPRKFNLTYKHKAALLLTALSSLMLEFTLIRVLSVSLWYHFAFMIISVALLGIGISGVTITISDRIRNAEPNKFLSITSLLYSISIIFSFIFTNKIPFDPFSLFTDSMQFLYLPLYYILVTLPFFLSGLIIGKLFSTFKNDINRLYFFDLVGAGLSCFVFILVLPKFGGSGGIAVSSLIAAIGCLLFSFEKQKLAMYTVIGSFVLLMVNGMFLTNLESFLPIRISENKVYANYMAENPELRILTKWNSFSKVDVYKDDGPAADNYPVYTAIIDAGNSTTNIPFVPQVKDSLTPPFDASNLAMLLKKDDTSNVFIVGSGGGGEILSALSFNAKNVTAVEINPILNELVEKDFANYWTKGLADNKKVKIITDDARGWLRSKRVKFDVIISAHTISASASNSGAMSLVENYIMTKEAVFDYMTHLHTDGILYITRPEPQVPKLITTIREAFTDPRINGIPNKSQFFIFKRPPSEYEKDVSYLSGIVFKKDGFSEFDIQLLKTQAALLNLDVLYDPTSNQEGIYKELIETDKLSDVYNKFPQTEPATDDKPYFEHNTNFTSITPAIIKESLSQGDRAMITMVQRPVAESVLILLLIQAIIISAGLILLPIFIKFRKDEKYKSVKKGKYLIYFASLGLGYIMIEICLIQKFTLFLGQPVYTMLTVISTMLIFSGIGSMFSNKVLSLFKNNHTILYIIIIALTLIIGIINQSIFELMVRADLTWKVLTSILLIAPLSFFMGIPFPYGMSKIDNNARFLVAYSWGINGFFSVLGSILVVILSMSYGFRVVFVIGALAYLTAMLVINKIKPAEA